MEEAKETTSEAERIRQFLEERSTAHAQLPKPKTPLTASELLAPLPPLPPPPHMGEGEGMRRNGGRHVKGASSASSSPSSRYGSNGYSILSANSLTSSSSSSSMLTNKGPTAAASTTTTTGTSTPVKRLSRSASLASKPSIRVDADKRVDEIGIRSGQDLTLPPLPPLMKKEQEQPLIKKEEETKRSGALLVNKAATSRPRRTGVRVPTTTTAAETTTTTMTPMEN